MQRPLLASRPRCLQKKGEKAKKSVKRLHFPRYHASTIALRPRNNKRHEWKRESEQKEVQNGRKISKNGVFWAFSRFFGLFDLQCSSTISNCAVERCLGTRRVERYQNKARERREALPKLPLKVQNESCHSTECRKKINKNHSPVLSISRSYDSCALLATSLRR